MITSVFESEVIRRVDIMIKVLMVCHGKRYVHTLEKPSKIKENRHSNTPKYAILYAKFFENP